jgi:dethiobiotin synthetase
MNTPGWFVTGTDTDCGKTLVTLGLMHGLRDRGLRVGGLKPVAAGAEPIDGELRNADALAIQALCDPPEPYRQINPYCFAPPIAPHIAAVEVGQRIEPGPILAARDALSRRHDAIVVEGAGGWRVPLGDDWDMADLAHALALPVVLVVGMRLGCLNHALLSCDAILGRGLTVAGWVATAVQPDMERAVENLAALVQRLPAPCLGHIPWLPQPTAARAAGFLALDRL